MKTLLKILIMSISLSLAVIPTVLAVGETESTLDKILGFLIPIIMVGLFLMLIYKAFKEPIDRLLAWGKEQINGKTEAVQQVRYKNGYMFPGNIGYMR